MLSKISSLNVFVIISVLVGGCTTARLESGFDSALTEFGVCQNYIYASTPDHTNLLVFKDSGSAAIADSVRSFDFSADDAGAIMYIEVGTELVDGFCSTGAVDDFDVESRYQATAGDAILTFTDAASPGPGFEASLKLTAITFEKELASDDPHSVTLETLNITGIVVE